MVALAGGLRGRSGPEAGDRPGISWSDGVVRFQDPRIFADPSGLRCRDFLRRIFRLEEVRSVEIDRTLGSALVRHDRGDLDIDRVFGRMSSTLRDDRPKGPGPAVEALPVADPSQPIVRVSRYGSTLSSWEVVHELPGRLRLRHEGLRKVGPFAEEVQGELLAIQGVRSCRVNPWTATLLVHHDPAALSTGQVLRVLDHIAEGSALALAHQGQGPTVRFGLANASVALAVAGEFAVPALLPASAALLVASNLRTFRAAWAEVRRREVGLPVLTTTIVGVTLVSGQFLAAALMGWSFKFWHQRHRDRVHATRRDLIPAMAQHRRFARLWTEGGEVEVTLEQLKPGALIVVAAGEAVPADGRVVRGLAVIDERPIRGGCGSTVKREGDRVFAGTRLASGDLRVEVGAVGGATRGAALARAIHSGAAHAPSPFAVTSEGEVFARRAVLPTLATAGLGLLMLDLTAAAAVLRPDYATGPGLGVSLEALRDCSLCAREGIIIRDAEAFRRLAEADLLLFDDHTDLERPDLVVAAVEGDGPLALQLAEAALRGLDDPRAEALRLALEARGVPPIDGPTEYGDRATTVHHEGRAFTVAGSGTAGSAPLIVEADGRPVGRISFEAGEDPRAARAIRAIRESDAWSVGLISGRPDREAVALADSLGIEHVRAGLSREGKVHLLRTLRERGIHVACVSDRRSDPAVAAEAHVWISLVEDFDEEVDTAPIVLLRGDLARIAGLRSLARSHVERVRSVHGSALIPNIACVVGAFFFGFTSLATVIITNLGTLGVYARWPHQGLAAARRDLPGGPGGTFGD